MVQSEKKWKFFSCLILQHQLSQEKYEFCKFCIEKVHSQEKYELSQEKYELRLFY